MQIAVLVYEHATGLDAIGPSAVLSRLPGAEVVVVAQSRGPIRCDNGFLSVVAQASIDEVTRPEILVVPGWSGARPDALLSPGSLQEWLTEVDAETSWTASVGTGSLALAAAELLDGRQATTHWLAIDDLAALGARAIDAHVVRDGKYLTAAGSAAGIDMALLMAGLVAGDDIARAIQLDIQYEPQPPYSSGSPRTAPPRTVSAMRALRTFIVYGSAEG